jgi:hypothetical protein
VLFFLHIPEKSYLVGIIEKELPTSYYDSQHFPKTIYSLFGGYFMDFHRGFEGAKLGSFHGVHGFFRD